MDPVSDGMIRISKDGKYGFITETGMVAVPTIWDSASIFSEGRSFVKINSLFDYIDKMGNRITYGEYDKASGFHNGYARVCSLGKWGFIDLSGKEVLPLVWDEATNIDDGHAIVEKDRKHYRLALDGTYEEIAYDSELFKEDYVPTYSQPAEQKTKTCLQCGAPIYADETWCDDCLFGAFGD